MSEQIDANAADLALADAHWWLRGFIASRLGQHGATSYEGDAEARIGRVRRWLQELAEGDAVLINAAPNDRANPKGFRMVVCEAELEHLFDGLRLGATANDQAAGWSMINELMARARRDRDAINNPTVAF